MWGGEGGEEAAICKIPKVQIAVPAAAHHLLAIRADSYRIEPVGRSGEGAYLRAFFQVPDFHEKIFMKKFQLLGKSSLND